MYLCYSCFIQPRVILSSFLSLLAPCRTRHRESRQRLHEFGRPTVAAGSIPALPTQQMLIQIRIKNKINNNNKKSQHNNNDTQNKTRYTGDRAKRGEREKREGERERTVSFTTCVRSGAKRGEKKNYIKEDSAIFNLKPDKPAVKSRITDCLGGNTKKRGREWGTSRDCVAGGCCDVNNPTKSTKPIKQKIPFLFSPPSSFPHSLTFLLSSSFFCRKRSLLRCL